MSEEKFASKVPLWKLERYLIGELPPVEMDRISKLKAVDPDVADWLRALEAEHADLQASCPTGHMAGRIWNKLKSGGEARSRVSKESRGLGWRGLGSAVLIPACAVILIMVFAPHPFNGSGNRTLASVNTTAPSESEATRLKGSLPELYLYRKSGGGGELLRNGNAVHEGDLIQVFYNAAGKKYGAIYSLDGRGKITWHLPEHGNQASLLSPSGKTALESAFELDAAPGHEDFHFVASDRPFALDSIQSVLLSGSGFSHAIFSLTKDSLK